MAEKEIRPPCMGSPIGKRRVMKEESSSGGEVLLWFLIFLCPFAHGHSFLSEIS